jgi:prepilin-type N-terminal cleavage/methylation domain-containing protein
MNARATHQHRGGDGGFTLTEMLIVMGIIVVVALVAVPSFRALTGGRSTEAAANQISAALARARLDAVGLQEPRGILFFRDPDTQRVGLMEVKVNNDQQPFEIDIAPDRDTLLLPAGVGMQFLDNSQNAATDDQYIGFNTRLSSTANTNETVVPYGGLILFDRRGQLRSGTWQFRMHYTDTLNPANTRASEMGMYMYADPSKTPTTSRPDVILPAPAPVSAVGFVLFEQDGFSNATQYTTAPGPDPDPQVAGASVTGPFAPDEQAEEKWLDENATPFLVNRYNGTLVRSQ